MNNDIFDDINNTLTKINQLSVQKKFVRDKLHATEFNEVIDKINELQEYINGPVNNVVINTTSYILDKIDGVKLSLTANKIMLDDNSNVSLLDEIDRIKNNINNTNDIINENTEAIASDINDIVSNLDTISYILGIHQENIEELTYNINISYNSAVETSVKQAKEYTDESYTRLYTYINDTTLTFDYDVRTEPTVEQKIIYDNNDDLYDGKYHD